MLTRFDDDGDFINRDKAHLIFLVPQVQHTALDLHDLAAQNNRPRAMHVNAAFKHILQKFFHNFIPQTIKSRNLGRLARSVVKCGVSDYLLAAINLLEALRTLFQLE
jgi:hypothetical protein